MQIALTPALSHKRERERCLLPLREKVDARSAAG